MHEVVFRAARLKHTVTLQVLDRAEQIGAGQLNQPGEGVEVEFVTQRRGPWEHTARGRIEPGKPLFYQTAQCAGRGGLVVRSRSSDLQGKEWIS
ncbi:MAG: hypothetical protein ACREL6_09140, partial [Gemmatimonadales bacterium]